MSVNLELVAYTKEGAVPFSFPRRVKKGWAGLELLGDATKPAGAKVGADPVLDLELNGGAAVRSAKPKASVAGESATAEETPSGDKTCNTTLSADLGLKRTLVGQAYIATSGVKASFTYSSGAESELGVAVSGSGASGTYKAQGTSKRSSSGNLTYPTLDKIGNRYYDTDFRYGKHFVACVDPSGAFVSYYQARVTSWAGGAYVRNPTSAPNARYCVWQAAGSSFEKTVSTAVSWTNGVSIKGSIGIDLSSKTGYTSSAKLRFDFPVRHQLCGTNDYPGGTPPAACRYQVEFASG